MKQDILILSREILLQKMLWILTWVIIFFEIIANSFQIFGFMPIYNDASSPAYAHYSSISEEPLIFEEEAIPCAPLKDPIICIGEFTVTAYCGENYPHICNDGDATKTSTGVVPAAGRTIAVDPEVIPYGTEVIIDGHSYIAEDCGGGIVGNKIDIFFENHSDALKFGKKKKIIYINKI